MKRIEGAVWLVGCLTLLSGIAAPGVAMGTGEDIAAAREALEAASEAFDGALKIDDADGVMAHVAQDVLMMPPGEAPVRGKAAMRAWYEGLLSQYRTVSLDLTEREILVGDAWAVVSGRHVWTMAPRAGGASFTDTGSYVQVWQRQPDGRWLFAREIWNSSVPPAAP